ncbi:MAG: hypothetical protein WCW27_05120 [Patescibacteria group bacterium]|jgi:hypothetical protein
MKLQLGSNDVVGEILKDNNNNGMPDIVEQAFKTGNVTTNVNTAYVVKGKQYNSLAEMPPADRAYVEQKMKTVTATQTEGQGTRPVVTRPELQTHPLAEMDDGGERLKMALVFLVCFAVVVGAIYFVVF